MKRTVLVAVLVIVLLSTMTLVKAIQYDRNTACGEGLFNKFVFAVDRDCKPYSKGGKYVFTYKESFGSRGVCFDEKGKCTEGKCDFSQQDGSFCAVGVGIDYGATKYDAICSSPEDAAWDSSSRACVECLGIYELGKYADQEKIYLSPESPRIDSSIMTLPSNTLGETRKTIETGCAIRLGAPVDAYWCDEYYAFDEGELLSKDQINFYLGKGIFRPNSYRKIISSKGDDFEGYDYSPRIPSEDLPPIATDCIKKNKFGEGKCAAYCGLDGQLHAMECVDDSECPDVFAVTKDPESSEYFPRYEIRLFKRHCGNRLPFSCIIDEEHDLDESKQICSAGGFQWLKAGEEDVGEYTDTQTFGCCGDDVFSDGEPKEFAKMRVVVGGKSDYRDAACCRSEDECVYEGTCFKEGTLKIIDGKKAHCYNGVWVATNLDLYYGYPSYVELPKCGDYICDVSTGENCFTCPIDCSFNREFSSVEEFDKEVMHKWDANYYPDALGEYHNNSFDLTWSKDIFCAPYSNLKFKSLYGWARKKTDFDKTRTMSECTDSDYCSGICGDLFYVKISGVDRFCVKAAPGDVLNVSFKDKDGSWYSKEIEVKKPWSEGLAPFDYLDCSEGVKVYTTQNTGVVCYKYEDISNELGLPTDIEVVHIDYTQSPDSVRSTCKYDSECESNNCAKFGSIGVCCPYGYKFDGENCYLPEQFDYNITLVR